MMDIIVSLELVVAVEVKMLEVKVLVQWTMVLVQWMVVLVQVLGI